MSDEDWDREARSRRKLRRRESDVPLEGMWSPPEFSEAAPQRPVPPAPRSTGGRESDAVVTKFDAARGFGFVALNEGGSAFLHISALQRAGMDVPALGSRLRVRIGDGNKGPQVNEIIGSAPASPNAPGLTEGEAVRGTVKWFNAERGFGFVKPDADGPDIFLHITALQRCQLDAPTDGQPILMKLTRGRKGLEVESLSFV